MYCRKRGTCFFFHHYPDIRYGMKFSQNNIEREDRDSRKGSSFFRFMDIEWGFASEIHFHEWGFAQNLAFFKWGFA